MELVCLWWTYSIFSSTRMVSAMENPSAGKRMESPAEGWGAVLRGVAVGELWRWPLSKDQSRVGRTYGSLDEDSHRQEEQTLMRPECESRAREGTSTGKRWAGSWVKPYSSLPRSHKYLVMISPTIAPCQNTRKPRTSQEYSPKALMVFGF